MIDSAFADVWTPDPVNRSHPLNRGRAAWWLTLPPLDGGAAWYDLAGPNHGALTAMGNGANGWRPSAGRPGGLGCLLFDGSAGYVAAGQPHRQADEWALAAWVRLDTGAGGTYTVVYNGDDAAGYGVLVRGGSLEVLYGSVAHESTSYAPAVGVWTRVLATRKAGTLTIYADGVAQSPTFADAPNVPTAGSFAVGCEPGGGRFFQGALDDVSVWGRGLSSAEALADFDLSRRGYPGVLNRVRPAAVASPGAAPVSGSGSPSLAADSATGAGSVASAGSGSDTLAPVASAGSGAETDSGSGSAVLPPVASSGSGGGTGSGSGSPSLTPAAAAGSGSVTDSGSGSPSLPGVAAAGAAGLTAPVFRRNLYDRAGSRGVA